MGLKINNNATTVLAASITNSATSISIQAGDGAKFPALGAGDWFPLTLVNASGGFEIVKVTARVTDVLTVVRAQEGTAGTAFTAGDRADLRLTAAAIATFIQASDALLASNALSELSGAAAATARGHLGLGTAATHADTDFATAAQGAKADTAVQPAALGTAAAQNVGYFATAAQGALAATAVQPAALGTAAALNVGGAAGNVPQIQTGGKYPGLDGSLITNLPVTGQPIPSSSTYAVGTMILAKQSGYNVAAGGTVVGSSIYPIWHDIAGTYNIGTAQTGTWTNVGGAASGPSSGVNAGLYVRTA